MKKHFKFFKRSFAFLLCCFIISSFFLFSSSAEVVSNDRLVYPFDVSWFEVSLINSNGTSTPVIVTVDGNEVNSGRVRLTIKKEDGSKFIAGQKYKCMLEMHIDNYDDSTLKYYNGEYMVKASYRLSIATTAAINVSSNNYASRSDVDYRYVTEDGSYTYNAYNVVTVDYPYSDIGDKYFRYMNSYQITFNTTTEFTTLNIYSVDFQTLSEADYYLGEKIDNSTNSIIDNQNKNSQEIIAAEKENTDKILNGGHSSPQYDGADEEAVNEYIEQEESLLGSLSDTYDDFLDWVSGFSGFISPGAAEGLAFISLFMNDFLNIPQFAMIWKVGLMLGLFSFLLGMVNILVRVSSNNRRYDSGRSKG